MLAFGLRLMNGVLELSSLERIDKLVVVVVVVVQWLVVWRCYQDGMDGWMEEGRVVVFLRKIRGIRAQFSSFYTRQLSRLT